MSAAEVRGVCGCGKIQSYWDHQERGCGACGSKWTQTHPPLPPAPPERWAIVEILGRRKLAGRIKEERRYGVDGITVEVPRGYMRPVGGGDLVPAFLPPIFHPGVSLYAVSEVSEAQAREEARSFEVDQTLELLGYDPTVGDPEDRVIYLTEKGARFLEELEQEKKRAPEAEVFTTEEGAGFGFLHAHAPARLEAEKALLAAGTNPAAVAYLGSKGNKHRYVDGSGNNLLVTISDKEVAVETVAKEQTW